MTTKDAQPKVGHTGLQADETLRPVLQESQDNRKTFPEKYVTDWIFEHASQQPDSIALSDGQTEISYAELERISDQYAAYLQQWLEGQNVSQSESLRFGVCFQPSLDEILVFVAIIKLGGCYVPLNPDVPKERQNLIVQDSQCMVIITEDDYIDVFNKHAVINIKALKSTKNFDTTLSRVILTKDLPLHIMYTSGSTGTPKGILATHGNMNNIIYGLADLYQMKNRKCLLGITRSIFDLFIGDLFLAFFHGLTFYIVEATIRVEPKKLAKLINRLQPDYLCTTPTIWREIVKLLTPFDHAPYFITNGEALDPTLAKQLCRLSTNCWNLYGPTETTLWASYTPINQGQTDIGKPFANYELYILDEQGHLVEPGVEGELYIGGPGLARYCSPTMNNDDYFNYFAKQPKVFKNKWLYKSGDRVLRDKQGKYYWLGRIDHQFKKHGQRIEPGEIESQLKSQAFVSTAAIICVMDEPSQPIVAFCQLEPFYAYLAKFSFFKNRIDKWVKQRLQKSLPIHMIPNAFIYLNTMPKTDTGKTDRQHLKTLYKTYSSSQPKEKASFQLGLEEYRLSTLWNELLPSVSPQYDADFFQSGGSSLLALRYIAKVNELFNVKLPVAWVYQYPTIGAQANFFRTHKTDAIIYNPILKLNHVSESAPKLFMFHPMISGAETYYELAQSISQYQVYSLEHYNLYHDKMIPQFDELVDHYLMTIMQHTPPSEIALGGWSFGGILALELANKLKVHGYHIHQVYLLDPLFLHSYAYHILAFFLQFPFTYQYVGDRFQGYLSNLAKPHRKRVMKATVTEFKMLAHFKRQTYNVPTLMFHASQSWIYKFYEFPGKLWRWQRHLPQCEVVEVDTNHLDMIYLPTAEIVSQSIDEKCQVLQAQGKPVATDSP